MVLVHRDTTIYSNTLLMHDKTSGEVEILTQAGDSSISRIKWGLGPPGEDFKAKGTDIITIRDGKIERCYTFIDT